MFNCIHCRFLCDDQRPTTVMVSMKRDQIEICQENITEPLERIEQVFGYHGKPGNLQNVLLNEKTKRRVRYKPVLQPAAVYI